jgi:transposase
MAMGKRQSQQEEMWIDTRCLPKAPGHPFYQRLNVILSQHGFDDFVESLCAPHYAERLGRPSLPPGVYFRLLMLGYFEGVDSERGIAWRVADSLTLRAFLGYEITEPTPDHSTLAKTRVRLPVELHQEVFNWMLTLSAKEGLLKGKTVGVDATSLEANAALRSIVRRDTGVAYQEYLEQLAKTSGIETPTREDLAKLDKKRPKKGSNDDWQHPHDPDALITKMKDGRTHLAHKVEHTVDLDTQAIIAVQICGADEGDTATLGWSLLQADWNLTAVAEDPQARRRLSATRLAEVVTDKGYHSNDTLKSLSAAGIRTHLSGQ